jgi:hypothetical protein
VTKRYFIISFFDTNSSIDITETTDILKDYLIDLGSIDTKMLEIKQVDEDTTFDNSHIELEHSRE